MIKNKPQDFIPQKEKLDGIYRGVVENNNDEEMQMGRCQIRIFGIHTDDLNDMPVEDLPWAQPALGLFEGSVSGYGSWTVPLQGSHVFLFFENGNHLEPRYFASVPGMPLDQKHGMEENSQGFKDPDGQYPANHRVPGKDFHKLTRGETEETIVQHKEENKEGAVNAALDEGSWEEPTIEGGRTYPHNKVFATHSGIVIEIDDSPEGERIHIFHPSNSYIEIGPDGQMIIKNAGEKFTIVGDSENKLVKNNKNTTVENNYSVLTKGEKMNEVGGDKTEEIKGSLVQESGGIERKTGTYTIDATQITHNSSGNYEVNAGTVQISAGVIQLN